MIEIPFIDEKRISPRTFLMGAIMPPHFRPPKQKKMRDNSPQPGEQNVSKKEVVVLS